MTNSTTFGMPLTRRDAAIRQLRHEIVTGELKPGALLKDAEVAARFQISVTPIREAMSQLEAEGLVESTPNRTRRVSRVTRKGTLDLFDVMTVLAHTAMEWGAPKLTADDLTLMRSHLRTLEEALASERINEAGLAGFEFSAVVLAAGGNGELQFHTRLNVTRGLRLLLSLSPDEHQWNVWRDGYRDILDHLERGDTKSAIRRSDEMYRAYRARLLVVEFPEET